MYLYLYIYFWHFPPFCSFSLGDEKVSMFTYPHKRLKNIKLIIYYHQADSPLLFGLMSDLVILQVQKMYGYTWHRMSLLRPDVIKQHKLKPFLLFHCLFVHVSASSAVSWHVSSWHCMIANICNWHVIVWQVALSITEEINLIRSNYCLGALNLETNWETFQAFSLISTRDFWTQSQGHYSENQCY